MLRASRRLLKSGGLTAFYAIFIAPGLSDRDYRRAGRAGPSSVTARRTPGQLLEAAGFDAVAETDASGEYQRVNDARHDARDRHAAGLRAVMGDEVFASYQAENRRLALALEDGILRRGLFVGRRPA